MKVAITDTTIVNLRYAALESAIYFNFFLSQTGSSVTSAFSRSVLDYIVFFKSAMSVGSLLTI
jgi:hypothetical protein